MNTTKRVVVIGTGAGGLAAAAYLARDGFDVLALEQAEHLGGYLNPFRRDGFLFDPGVHYVGECSPGRIMHEVLTGLDIDPTALFCELEPDGFDVYQFPDFEVRACRGLDEYRARLSALFPHERDGLVRLFDVVRRVDELVSMTSMKLGWSTLKGLAQLPFVMRWASRTFDELLLAHIADPRLRAVLAAAGGDYGLPPGRASAIVGLQLLAHYAHGAFFPRGGSGALRDALVGAAERHGARFRTRARVARILTDDGRASSVILDTGELIAADVVVSDVNPVRTLGQMLDPEIVPRAMRKKLANIEHSLGVCGLFLGMRRDLRAHGLGRFNVWSHSGWNIDAEYAPVFEGRLPDDPMLFLSPNSLKDDSGAMAPAGSSTLEIVTMAPYSMFKRWSGKPCGERGPEYQAEKTRIADWMLSTLERRWPGLVGDVVVQEVSTPLTDEHYTLAVEGGIYGPAMTPAQTGLRRFRPVTFVPNLVLAGAGVFGDGVAPCLYSGRVAAAVAAREVAPARRRLLRGRSSSGSRGTPAGAST